MTIVSGNRDTVKEERFARTPAAELTSCAMTATRVVGKFERGESVSDDEREEAAWAGRRGLQLIEEGCMPTPDLYGLLHRVNTLFN